MNITVFLFFIIVSSILIIIFTEKKPENNDNCYENKIKFYDSLKSLLYVYICILFVLLIFYVRKQENVCINTILLIYGFITISFILFLGLNIQNIKIECLMNNIKIYLSVIPLFIFGILSIFMGYLGNILNKRS